MPLVPRLGPSLTNYQNPLRHHHHGCHLHRLRYLVRDFFFFFCLLDGHSRSRLCLASAYGLRHLCL